MDHHEKIVRIEEINNIVAQCKSQGQKIVQCHGVFDLVHPGHIRHLQEAKNHGDKLVVTLTPDNLVNKGPGRPVFNQTLRMETLASLGCVDYVVLNNSPDATSAIKAVKPDVYIKGIEYKDHEKDITGKIALETALVREFGGEIHYTDDIVFSSTELLNTYFNQVPEDVRLYMNEFKQKHSLKQMLDYVVAFSDLKVLVIGDAILDEYQYVTPLGQSAKGSHLTTKLLEREVYAGGAFAIANHIAEYTDNVTLITAIGEGDEDRYMIDRSLNKNITKEFVQLRGKKTLTKKRYVYKETSALTKLFETYSCNEDMLTDAASREVCALVQGLADDFDLVLACDFGNGFTNKEVCSAISYVPNFLAVNAQTNSGNRGYNVITRYDRADYFTLNEPELRQTVHDRHSNLEELGLKLARQMLAKQMAVTRGTSGLLVLDEKRKFHEMPAFSTKVVDRVGAGDCFLALSSLGMVKGIATEAAALIGSIAAALDVQIVGNKEPVSKISLCKYLTTLMK